MYLVDTCVIIPCLRRSTKQAYLEFLSEMAEDEAPAVSAITRFEVMAGTLTDHLEVNRRFLDGFQQLATDARIADIAGRLFFDWSRKGHALTANDLLIGATARAHGLVLLTTNRKHFPYLTERERRTIRYQALKERNSSDTVYFLE